MSVVNKTYVFSFAFINPKLKIILALQFPHFTGMGKNRQYRRILVFRWLGKKGWGSKQVWLMQPVANWAVFLCLPGKIKASYIWLFPQGRRWGRDTTSCQWDSVGVFLLSWHLREILARRKVFNRAIKIGLPLLWWGKAHSLDGDSGWSASTMASSS